MNPEIDRIKNDLETIQQVLGLRASAGPDWIQWMKRDRWRSFWWCLPGCILIASALLPIDHAARHLGMVADQWAGVLVAVTLLGLGMMHARQVKRKDGRPEALLRESKCANGMNAQGYWFSIALLVQLALYFVWCRHYNIPFEPFWAGFFILTGSTCLVGAVIAKAWTLLGYAVPFLGYGLCLPLAEGHHKINAILFGMMFISVALSFFAVQQFQIRQIEKKAA
jgi:hypothetical protein